MAVKINQRGKLFVIVGRQTFSAAMNGAAEIERHTNAIFVGEPTGSSPNFVGETIGVNLTYSKMRGSISDLYWQSSVAMDYRTWISHCCTRRLRSLSMWRTAIRRWKRSRLT